MFELIAIVTSLFAGSFAAFTSGINDDDSVQDNDPSLANSQHHDAYVQGYIGLDDLETAVNSTDHDADDIDQPDEHAFLTTQIAYDDQNAIAPEIDYGDETHDNAFLNTQISYDGPSAITPETVFIEDTEDDASHIAYDDYNAVAPEISVGMQAPLEPEVGECQADPLEPMVSDCTGMVAEPENTDHLGITFAPEIAVNQQAPLEPELGYWSGVDHDTLVAYDDYNAVAPEISVGMQAPLEPEVGECQADPLEPMVSDCTGMVAELENTDHLGITFAPEIAVNQQAPLEPELGYWSGVDHDTLVAYDDYNAMAPEISVGMQAPLEPMFNEGDEGNEGDTLGDAYHDHMAVGLPWPNNMEEPLEPEVGECQADPLVPMVSDCTGMVAPESELDDFAVTVAPIANVDGLRIADDAQNDAAPEIAVNHLAPPEPMFSEGDEGDTLGDAHHDHMGVGLPWPNNMEATPEPEVVEFLADPLEPMVSDCTGMAGDLVITHDEEITFAPNIAVNMPAPLVSDFTSAPDFEATPFVVYHDHNAIAPILLVDVQPPAEPIVSDCTGMDGGPVVTYDDQIAVTLDPAMAMQAPFEPEVSDCTGMDGGPVVSDCTGMVAPESDLYFIAA